MNSKSPLSHNTNTRGVLKLTTEFYSHSSRSSFLFTRAVKIWNALPNPVKLAKSINGFKFTRRFWFVSVHLRFGLCLMYNSYFYFRIYIYFILNVLICIIIISLVAKSIK